MMIQTSTSLHTEAIELLKQLIATPSLSKEEDDTAEVIIDFLESHGVTTHRLHNNIWATNKHFEPGKPTLLLNSHHDTVKPNDGYTRDPHSPEVEDGKLFGLGSNDAGGPLVSLMATFLHFHDREDLAWNVVFCASAEEEISGDNGMRAARDVLPEFDCAIVGEPTQMKMAIAEKGLLILDCTARGTSGHAAHDGADNAIYKAMKDIEWFRTFGFSQVSESLGPIKMTVTIINAGSQHNVVPDRCTFTVDVRTTDAYSLEDVLQIIDDHTESEIAPRSVQLRPSSIPTDHPLVTTGKAMGIETYGSPTLSDQSLLPVPSLKMGPGDSNRSHTADEFIKLSEIEEGIDTYIELLSKVLTIS
ncbi:M20 family metallo-hydrolase [Halalkalibaculum sp. DA3122]|uniref:M20 family metallo-hydrolase n=1 Tax=Halalkalibaculum sp. DA3122 TaxID=3373607 RepID=UPI003755111A